ncbi:MAG: zinc ABC transporter solute-binding protein [Bacteroidetes bacterium]|jgi:lactam utilization protein B|nr:zinc ABC transporter solute-binding protein [Bacteroidota bacterium]
MPSSVLRIDLNADLGESTHQRPLPGQEALFPYLSSCNIACGFHGGDPLFIEQAIRQAIAHGLRIGAHPSYPDRANFGRKPMPLPPERLQAEVRYQVAALKSMAESLGGRLSYVKPHGALYNQMAFDEPTARPVLAAVKEIDTDLALMGLAGSPLQKWAASAGLRFIAEAFAEQDPDNATTYAENAARYKDALRATLEPLLNAVDEVPQGQRWLVTCEGAFSYLARDMGLQELYLWPMNADQVGTPQQVRSVIDGVRHNNIPVVFCESTVNTSPAEQVARETGAAYGGVLYVDSLSNEDGPVPTYLDLLRVTTQTVADGLTSAAN